MTAIGGIVGLGGYVPDRATISRMRSALTKFGRDAQHEAWDGPVAMVRTLLRSTPEALLDRQPLVHRPSRTMLVFDGRVDNREELAANLGIPSARLSRMADVDLVLEAVFRWGAQAPEQLVGDFGIAVWNGVERVLWLARDPIGVRPLYWCRQDRLIAFSTQALALFTIDGVVKELDTETLHDTLTLIPVRGERSFFTNIQRVMPGHVVQLFADGRKVVRRYHDFRPGKTIRFKRDDDYVAAFHEELNRAVRSRLRARGEVVSHLSSGLDSSTVTAVAARLLAGDGKTLHAVTLGPREGFNGPVPPGRHGDETVLAAQVAHLYPNIKHSIYRHNSASPLEGLDDVLDAMGRPPLNLDNVGWFRGMQQFIAATGARVVLSGQYGNFGLSYPGRERLSTLFVTGQWVTLLKEYLALRRRYPKHHVEWFLESTLGPAVPEVVWRWWRQRWVDYSVSSYSAIHPDAAHRMGTKRRAAAAGHTLSFQPPWRSVEARIYGLQFMDLGDYALTDDVCGVESRHPLADTRFLKFLFAIPDDQFQRHGEVQVLFRRAMHQVLPPALLSSRTRGLQAADFHETFSRSVSDIKQEFERFLSVPAVADLLHVDSLRRDLEESGPDWSRPEVEARYRLRLLRGLSVGRFVYRHSEKN